ncbi:Hsp20/alpha crystallin family protein [Catalinimonas niigatensis]|uniref:Hsp20/alpha crystallin family protein n=1 Tax=Catalinimonas niigatensis TaxID=1397264 RepID=UPI0026660698|nr:Hsp20/alpha crystallin family protein [Catalinimonas niigatensis]WPP49501.1 Hsp20/alpha crystallin family protein [Catalinimonas niigatensis]
MMKNVLKDFVHQFDTMNTIGGGVALTTVNINRESDHLTINISAPSINSDAFNIFVRGNQLVVYSVLNEVDLFEDEEKKSARHMVPMFNRVFDIPAVVDKDQIEAIYDHGVLKLHLPYGDDWDATKVKKINIKEY